jgi:hypothetical protein
LTHEQFIVHHAPHVDRERALALADDRAAHDSIMFKIAG